MELTTLISPEEAAEQLRVYEAQLAEERTAEDDAIRAGYRAAARGNPVIELSTAVAAGGWFRSGLPRIAVVRADATECWVNVRRPQWDGAETELVFTDNGSTRGWAMVGRHRVAVSVPTPEVVTNRAWRGRTIVPSIPPNHRPRRTRLHRFHILWEVERWAQVAPRDPALLRHIRGDLWAVMATWDLTDLERAVLSARRS